jgi:hypothetical protein
MPRPRSTADTQSQNKPPQPRQRGSGTALLNPRIIPEAARRARNQKSSFCGPLCVTLLSAALSGGNLMRLCCSSITSPVHLLAMPCAVRAWYWRPSNNTPTTLAPGRCNTSTHHPSDTSTRRKTSQSYNRRLLYPSQQVHVSLFCIFVSWCDVKTCHSATGFRQHNIEETAKA